ncbi:MAG: hypothetical protein FWG05_06125, partial [Kiritimatiellaeota bacterium]|nr:hypothetical protein [Kiritimatiellota bacterium]
NKLQSELSTLVSEHSEFLDFANTRDSEYAAKVASLETALAKATDENAALKNDHTRAVAELIALIRQLTADEAARVAAAQTASARFQAAVIDCVNKMEQTGGQDPLIVERRETARRISALEIKLEQTRARLEHAERHAADFDAISLRLKNKEAALSDAEQEFSVALLKWQAENQALKFRIEELEHEIGN